MLFAVIGPCCLAACAAKDPVESSAQPATDGTDSEASASGAPGMPTAPATGTSSAPASGNTVLVPAPSVDTAPSGTQEPAPFPTVSASAPESSTPAMPSASSGDDMGSGGTADPPVAPTTPSSGTDTPAPSASADALPPPTETNKDHCLYGYDPLPSDDTMASGPFLFTPPGGGSTDTVVQPEVLEWMDANRWQGAHVVWHAVRACSGGFAGGLLAPLGYPDICTDYPFLVPEDQNCQSAGDGYQFLLFHRHMIETMKQLWPKHAEDFDGFDKFPTSSEELPEVWNENDPTWSAQILEAAEIADNIEDHLDKFPDEGSVGFWLQCAVGTRAPSFAPDMPYIGLHFNLHDQWSRGANSTHGLNNGQVNITNYMFWKLHGWIDKVWEKYRVAKGLTTDAAAMQKYKADLVAQCREMDLEAQILQQDPGEGPVLDCPPEVDETGEFHTLVRPILENDANHCASCHGPAQTSPYVGLTLGGSISSRCVVERLKRESINGGQFKLVEPGDPENSWLYLKASGQADAAGCVDGTNPCNTATMPPSGRTMTDEELEILYNWIADGAN
jgi:hypothetical protein